MWCTAPARLGWLTGVTNDFAGALGHFTAVRDVVADLRPSSALVDALAGRAMVLLNVDRIREAAEDARRTLGLARGLGYPDRRGAGSGEPQPHWFLHRRPRQRVGVGAAGPAKRPGTHPRLDCPRVRRYPDGCADGGRRGGCGTAQPRGCAGPRPAGRRPSGSGVLPDVYGEPGPAGRPHVRCWDAPAGSARARYADRRPAPHDRLPSRVRAPVRREAALGRGHHDLGGTRRVPARRQDNRPRRSGCGTARNLWPRPGRPWEPSRYARPTSAARQ
jgi:hypothetical protein